MLLDSGVYGSIDNHAGYKISECMPEELRPFIRRKSSSYDGAYFLDLDRFCRQVTPGELFTWKWKQVARLGRNDAVIML